MAVQWHKWQMLRRCAFAAWANCKRLSIWLAAGLWDWGTILFIVPAFWVFGAIGIGAALAEPIPSAMEIAGAALLMWLGGLFLLLRVLHSAWKTHELTSLFQRAAATAIALALFLVLTRLGAGYLSEKVPLLTLNLSLYLPHPPKPPTDVLPIPPTGTPRHNSYLAIDGVPLFSGSNPNGSEGANFRPGDPLAFNLHFRATGPEAIHVGAAGMETFLEPDDNPETLKNAYKSFLDDLVTDKRIPTNQGREQWQLFTQGTARFNTAYVLDRTTGHPVIHMVTQAELDNLKSGTLIAVVIAFFDYKDEGQIHHLWFCNFLQPPAQPPGIWHEFKACPGSD